MLTSDKQWPKALYAELCRPFKYLSINSVNHSACNHALFIFSLQSLKHDVYSMLILQAGQFGGLSMPVCHIWHIWQLFVSWEVPWWAMCPQVDGHNLIGQSPQEKHLLRAVLNLWSGSLVLQSKVHGTKSNIWCTFITLRDKKNITQKPNVWKKNLHPALSPAAWKFREGAKCSLRGNQSMSEQSWNHTWHALSGGSSHLAEDVSRLLYVHWSGEGLWGLGSV